MKKIFTLLTGLLILWSCGQKEITVTHLPFKAETDDRWGLIGTDGKILFENEFENEPSFVINGVFFVKNTDGLYEYYTAEKKPKRIGDKTYANAGYFVEDVAPVAEPERHISFIRRDGTQAFMLDYYKDEEIVEVSPFYSGRAAIKLKSGKQGFIDTKGKVVIAPQFSDVRNFSEGLAVVYENDSTAYVINTAGKQQFDLKAKRDKEGNIPMFGKFKNGLLSVGYGVPESDVHWTEYYLNTKGEKAFNMPSKVLINTDFKGGYALCSKATGSPDFNEYQGVIDKKGEIVIRPKYNSENIDMQYEYGGFVADGFVCMADKGKYGLVDLKDNVICPFRFDEIFPFYNGKHAFAKERDAYHLIDKKGNEADKKEYAVVTRYSGIEYNGAVKSDHLDISGAIKSFFANCEGKRIGPIALDEKVEQLMRNFDMEPNKKALSGQYITSFSEPPTPGYTATYEAHFNRPVASPVTSGYWWDSRTVGYAFNTESKINVIVVSIDFNTWVSDQANRIEKVLKDYLKSSGYELETSGTWNKMPVEVFSKSDDLPTVSLSKPSFTWGNFRIIFGLTNNK